MDKRILGGICAVLVIGGVFGCKSPPAKTDAAATKTNDTKKDAPKAADPAKKVDLGAVESKKVNDGLAAAKGIDASKISVATDFDKKTVTVSGLVADNDQVGRAMVAAKKSAGKSFEVINNLKAPELDLDAGYKKVAAVWSEMTPEQVEPLMKGYSNTTDVANILKKMDEDQVAQILGALATDKDPDDKKRAVELCKELQVVSSLPKSA